MIKRLLTTNLFPACMRREHPLVRLYLRQRAYGGLNYAVFGSAVGMFLLFGGLSLPMLYLLLSLIVVLQQTTANVHKITQARANRTWELVRVTPFSRRELLLSTWAGSFWQLNRSWVMPLYRLLQAMVIVGLVIYSLWAGDIPMEQWLTVLAAGTLLILFQPLVEMYFSGMVGLLCASVVRDNLIALGLAALAMLLCWLGYVGGSLWLLFADTDNLGMVQIAAVVALALVLPTLLGYTAQRLAERH